MEIWCGFLYPAYYLYMSKSYNFDKGKKTKQYITGQYVTMLTLMYNCETFANFYVSRTRELSLATTLAKNMVEISTMRL